MDTHENYTEKQDGGAGTGGNHLMIKSIYLIIELIIIECGILR